MVQYKFPIEDKEEAKQFINEIKDRYRYSIPLLQEYMLVNPTDKLVLPENSEVVEDINLTLPITTKKQLIETARLF
ncbi:hypothetical protein F8M41_005731 [Gigaspora margarita]|uniref:Uncharacterized protein n=1 Tax=Gigaspora margarita TaxID=4874 RepID=A0A8H3X8Y7_GIGMA|nr:hypothetical protein F8M41_005731 [Gigaspora margarita]